MNERLLPSAKFETIVGPEDLRAARAVLWRDHGHERAVAVSSLRGEAMVVLIEVLAILALVAIVIWWLGLGRNPDDDGDAH